MKIFGKNKQSGFSLVELMIVVGIIGVLATLALPRFKQFQSKAKMAEAMNVLQHVYTLEQSYSLDNNTFIAFGAVGAGAAASGGNVCTYNAATHGALGLVIEPCVPGGAVPRFSYSATSANASVFQALAQTGVGPANRICPGNPAFTIGLNQGNQVTWGAGQTATPATGGQAPIGTVCPN